MGTENLSKRASTEDSTVALVTRFRAGDRHALSTLTSRYLQPFRRWVQCRTPSWAQESLRTERLVERTLNESLDEEELARWFPRSFQSHLRRRILDHLEDEIHRIQTSAKHERKAQSSTLERAIGRDSYERYESALRRLSDEDRELIIARIELNFPYSKVAAVLGRSNPDEAREAVIQAVLRLAKEMGSST